MTTLGLSHINLRAGRELLDELKAFYCDVVGLRVGPRPPFMGFGYWLYCGEQPIVHLSETDPGEERDTRVATTLDHVAFDCANVAAVEEVLKRRAVQYQSTVVPASRQVQLFFRDPGGTKVELNFGTSND